MKNLYVAFAACIALMLPVSVLAVDLYGETVSTESGQGQLQVSLESSQLLGAVPKGATRIDMGTLNISASCDSDVTVTGLTVKHTGLGDASDITAVYLNDGFRRISRSRTFDRQSRSADLRVTALTVKKCEAVRVKILVDISRDATVAAEHGVTVSGASAVTSTAKSVTFLESDITQRVFTSPRDAGNITVNLLPIRGPLRYGRRETVARLQLTADSRNDHLLRSVTFTNLGDARDMHLLDFTLETRTGEVLTPLAQRMRGYAVTLQFDPTYILHRGRTVVFLLKAQINASQSKKVNFTIEEPSDLQSVPYRPSR